ncbi:hypothetical protein [Stomatohabitans albus]|uniref:hypothetical protein n=1 Tax=Stomatohabitans albus TaxID=3110766 RepID=UPI00300CE536
MAPFEPLVLPQPPIRFLTSSTSPPREPALNGRATPYSEETANHKPATPPSAFAPTQAADHAEYTQREHEATMPTAGVVINDDGLGMVNGQPVWECRQCGNIQSLDTFLCERCGNRFGDEKPDPIALAQLTRNEWYFPGYGFYLAGRTIHAITRVLITAGWLGMAIFVALQRPLVALPLFIGIGVIWVTSPKDLERTLLGQEPFLNAKNLLLLITGTLLAFILVGAADFYLGTRGFGQ